MYSERGQHFAIRGFNYCVGCGSASELQALLEYKVGTKPEIALMNSATGKTGV